MGEVAVNRFTGLRGGALRSRNAPDAGGTDGDRDGGADMSGQESRPEGRAGRPGRAFLALLVAAALWLPILHLFFKPDPGRYRSAGGIPERAVALAARHMEMWGDPRLGLQEIRKMRVEKKLPQNILQPQEMNKLLEHLHHYDRYENLKDSLTAYRVPVIAELMYATGLRISEVAQLRPEDINFSRGTVRVQEGKGGVSRIALLNDYACQVLQLYVDRLRDVVLNKRNRPSAHLLFGANWTNLGKTVNRFLAKQTATLPLPIFTSHGFRHALGFHLLKAGCNIRYIQSILGHKLLRNTEIYTKVEKDDLKDVLDTFHPRASFKGDA